MNSKFIQAGDIRFHVVEAGSHKAPLLLMLHGFPSTHHCWRHQMPELAKHFHVVAPDMRGYNLTDKPKDGYDLDTLAQDAVNLMHALGHKKMTLAGHDWGGVVAWHVAAQHPEALNKLIILNAPHPAIYQREMLGNLDQFKKAWYVFFFQLPLIPEMYLKENNFEKMVASFRAAAVKDNRGAFTDEDIEHYRRAFAEPEALPSMLAYYRTSFRAMVKNMLMGEKPETPVIQTPTQVIWGMQDTALGPGNLDGLDEHVAHLRVDRVEDSGHWVQEEKPDEVNRLMAEFLGFHAAKQESAVKKPAAKKPAAKKPAAKKPAEKKPVAKKAAPAKPAKKTAVKKTAVQKAAPKKAAPKKPAAKKAVPKKKPAKK